VLSKLTDLKVWRGITLPDFATAREQLTVKARQLIKGGVATVALELTDAQGGAYYRCTAEWGDAAVYDGELLFHGPDFQAIKNIGGISDAGMAAELTGVAQSTWTEETGTPATPHSWSSDPLAFDGGLQLALLWCKRVLGGASLPTSIAEIRIWDDAPNLGAIHCTLTGQSAKGSKSVSDIAFRDAAGKLLAEFIGIETHLLPTSS